jgi:hypothetical protein
MLSTPWSLRWTSICKSWGPPLLVACSLSPRLRFLEHNNIVQFPYLLLSNSQTLLSSLSKIVLVDTSFAFLRCSFLANTLQLRETIISRNCCFFFFRRNFFWSHACASFMILNSSWLLAFINSEFAWLKRQRTWAREEEEEKTILLRAFVLWGQRLCERQERARENRNAWRGEWAAPQR